MGLIGPLFLEMISYGCDISIEYGLKKIHQKTSNQGSKGSS